MKKPNPTLRNTAIHVGDDAELRKRAIEYYEANGYERYGQTYNDEDYVFAGERTVVSLESARINISNYTIITLPEPEPKAEYPCMMLVSDDEEEWVEANVIFKDDNVFVVKVEKYEYEGFNFAKPIPTTTITTEELIEYYEKNTNTKVILI